MKKIGTIATNLGNSTVENNQIDPESTAKPSGLGDPNCPICGGLGFVGSTVPVGHPDFGRLKICSCRMDTVGKQERGSLYRMSNLGALSHLTFNNFQPRGRVGMPMQQANSLEQAFNTAQHFAGSLQGWLLLLGRYGSGKTHLAAAIANQALSMGVPTLFLTVPDLLDWLRFAYSNPSEGSFEDRFEEIRGVELLVLDDFGTQNATAWATEKLFQILNHRYISKLPTVLTSNNQLTDFEGRIRSRLMDPELVTRVEILAPDFRNPTDDIGHPELSSLHLHGKQTFDNFYFRQNENLMRDDVQSLREALQAAKTFAEDPRGWIVLQGGYGIGKTHLAAAIGNYQAAKGMPPLMVVVPDLLDYLRASFSPNSGISLDRRFEEIRSAQLLILDDLGTQSATPWAREKIYQLFNHRYVAELPTVITTSSLPSELDQRLYSRMSDRRLCKVVYMSAPAYTGGAGYTRKGT